MSQLLTLFWLRYTIFKNSLTRRSDAARVVLNAVVLAIPLLLSVAFGAALFLLMLLLEQFREPVLRGGMTTLLATLLFLMLISQSTGTSAHFDPRRFALFPVRLNKLFLLNLVAAFGELSLLALLPAVAGVLIGLGVALGHPLAGVIAFLAAVIWINSLFMVCGLLFAWLLSGRKRRSEVLFALLIGLLGIGGQVLPRVFITGYGRNALHWLRPHLGFLGEVIGWTPLGVWGGFFDALRQGAPGLAYARLIAVCAVWTGLAWAGGYVLFKMLATSPRTSGGGANSGKNIGATMRAASFLSLKLPLFSDQASAVFAKEWRYLTRNTATYLTALSALIFPLIMLRSFDRKPGRAGAGEWNAVWIAVWMSYVFLINLQHFMGLFSFEGAGFRQYLLAPLEWRRLLVGKNLATWCVISAQVCLILLGAHLLDHALTPEKIYVACCSLLTALAFYSMGGNFLSIRFPYRVNYGVPAKRTNEGWSGLSLLIQLVLVLGGAGLMAIPIALGYLLQSRLAQYVLQSLSVVVCWSAYAAMLNWQGRLLEARRFEIAEALTRKAEKI